ncbi:MAG: VOC family protein, partial [Gaiellaceae bacterium]
MSPQLDAFGIVVSDMARALAFYRNLGLEFPEGAESEGHVEAQLPGGMRYMLDREDVIASFDPEWKRPDDAV